MLVKSTPLQHAAVIEREPIRDTRGYFARSFCRKTLVDHGILFDLAQTNIAFNDHPYTIRGMHFQLPPYSEEKIITCTQGSIYDVIIDLNLHSSTFGKWFGITLSEKTNYLYMFLRVLRMATKHCKEIH